MSDAAQVPESEIDRSRRTLPPALRYTAFVAGALALVLVATAVAGVVVVRGPFPQAEGELELPGLGGPVEVLRDEHGIPHIYADTAEDLFRAQGFVHAQDRFYEMDVRRHTTAGRLSELLGPDALQTDKFIRVLGWRRVAEEELSLLAPTTRRYLDAYSEGVNGYLESRPVSDISLAYSVLTLGRRDYEPEPWTPADSVSWLKAMAWDLRGNMEDEIERAILSASLDRDRVDSLFPPYPYDRHRPIVDRGAVVDGVFEQDATGGGTRKPARPALSPEVVETLTELRSGLDALPDLVGQGAGIGSNSWVVSGEHTRSGAPLLANDPHLGLSLPGVWHQMGLHCRELSARCPFDMSGFTFAGLPGQVIGHNHRIAWGFTNMGPDVSDLFLERIEDGEYVYGRRRLPLETRRETIEVAGGDPFVMTVRATRHGPLLSDVSAELSRAGANADVSEDAPERGNGYAVALAWTGLIPTRTADALFALNTAANWDEFRAAAQNFAVPAQNLVYADVDGHIGYQAPGLIPVRRSGTGDYPREGWDPAQDWSGATVPFEALPNVLDPEEGLIVAANQAVVGEDYPFHLTDAWDHGYRSQRLWELLEGRDDLDVAATAEVQLDSHHGLAPALVPYLLDLPVDSGWIGSGRRVLRGWDHMQPEGSPAAAYFNAVWRNLLAITFHDELPEATWPDGSARWFEVVRGLLETPEDPWWDIADTDRVENRDDVLYLAMLAARDELTRTHHRQPERWRWGHHHVLRLEERTLGQAESGMIRRLFNRGPYAVGGGESAVNATGWTAFEGYAVDWAPSMRMVVDLADLDASRWVSLTGVSGHPFHRNYVDQTELWTRGETLPWRFTPAAVREAAEDLLTLVPADE